ncbi:MAG: GNAT family N-acetyltransferase [Vicingaceae bacterium]
MNLLETSILSPECKEQVFELWNREYPVELQNENLEDMLSYMDGLEDLRHGMLMDNKSKIQAWFATYKNLGEQRFIIIIAREAQGQGHGSFILDHLKKDREVLHGWVIDEDRYQREDGSPYRSPLDFYRKHGFEVLDERLERALISGVKVKWTRQL